MNNNIPIIEAMKMNSMLKIKSGKVMIIDVFIESKEDKQILKVTLH
ncbi:MAG: hypothetical protein ACR5KW_03185 [Wolbachia sp.]